MNTMEQMPRTPQEAGLIGVVLKRKREYWDKLFGATSEKGWLHIAY